ncbi:MAG: hypothetical protein KDJ35_02460 [Alphaproteobacteria bacterium]|nr:hypothetical protein [Alphaproteobacteria bacterium]
MVNNNKTNELVNSQIKQIEGVLFSAMKALSTLAPHPDKPHQSGPLFIQADSAYKPAAEYDGMLGSLLIESTLGGAFGSAAAGIGWNDILECVSDFMQDRQSAPAAYKVGQSRALCSTFNTNSDTSALLAAYMRDLPRRLGMERWVADYQRKLYALQKHAAMGLAA